MTEQLARFEELIAVGRQSRQKNDPTSSLAAFEAAAALKPYHEGVQLEVATELRTLGRFTEAEATLQSVLTTNPTSVGAVIGVAHIRRRQGDRQASLDAFRRAHELSPKNLPIQLEIANDLRELGNLDEAEACVERALADHPRDTSALIGLAHIRRRQGHRLASLETFRAALATHPRHEGLQLEIASDLRELGNIEEAESILRLLIYQSPKNSSAWIMLGHLKRKQDLRNSSLMAFEAAHQIAPNQLGISLEVCIDLRELGRFDEAETRLRSLRDQNPSDVSILIALGQLHRKKGDRRGSLGAFQSAALLDPVHLGVQLEIANEMRELGQNSDAEQLLLTLTVKHPKSLQPLMALGDLARRQGDRSKSLAIFQAAAKIDPVDVRIQIEIANDLRELRRLAEAQSVLDQLFSQHPKNVSVLIALAHLKRREGDRHASLDFFQAAASQDPTHVGAQIETANDLRDLGRYADASALLHQAIAKFPRESRGYVGLAHLRRRQGDREASLSAFQTAATLAPESFDIHVEISNDLRELGHLEEAASLIERLLEMRPSNIWALMQRVHLLRRQNAHDAALVVLQQLHQENPEKIQFFVEIAATERALGRPDLAEKWVHDALAREPDNLAALLQRADLAFLSDDYEAALNICQHAAELHPANVWPRLNGARAMFELGQPGEAFDLIRKARKELGSQPEIAIRQVELLRSLRDWDGARDIIAQELDLDSPNFQLATHGIQVEIITAHFVSAKSKLDVLKARTPHERARCAFLYGELAESQLEFITAANHYREATELNPNDAACRFALSRVSLLLLDLTTTRRELRHFTYLIKSWLAQKQQSQNISQNHVGQLLDEFLLDATALEKLRHIRAMSPKLQLEPLKALVREEPDYTPSAIMSAIALREAGQFAKVRLPAGDANVPKQIVQFWDEQPPPDILGLMESWRDLNPGYRWQCFDDDTASAFLRARFPTDVLEAYLASHQAAQKADIFRIAYLVAEGGIYVDADDRCLAPIDSFIDTHDTLTVYQEDYGSIGNNFIAAAPGHPVLRHALARVVEAMKRGDKDLLWLSTGPGLLTRAFASEWAAPNENWFDQARVMRLGELQRVIGIHCPVRYKNTDKHWSRASFGKRRKRAA